MGEKRYLTVQALTKYIKRKFDFDPHLQDILVKGEISNFKRHTSGHMYFTLKDEKARIAAVMFSANAQKIRFQPEDGMTVLVRGEVTVYEQNGQYQIYVKEMQPDGIGDLYLAFEQLKKKLAKEGLFNKEWKKPIPKYPETVGVVTSPTGAAIRDIITTIQRRFPIARIIIYPALVQGTQAAESIAKAIGTANERKEADVLIVGRGGGSIEELWAFNEEVTARAIFQSAIPVISAVGHETDTTISDFVSDLRAPTPTGAAEMAVPNRLEISDKILSQKVRLYRALSEKISREKSRLDHAAKSYAFKYPKRLYEQKMEYLDRMSERLIYSLKTNFSKHGHSFQFLFNNLQRSHPKNQLRPAKDRLNALIKRMNLQTNTMVKMKQREFLNSIHTLEALSPLKIMQRGYSILYDENKQIVKSVHDVKVGDQLAITVQDGEIHTKVTRRKEK